MPSADLGLTARLRAATAGAHASLEQATRLPDGIATVGDYAACLRRFHCVVAPLEAQISGFQEFGALGFTIGYRAPLLRADLTALGVSAPPPLSLPPMPGFAAALGALYVLEGAALGGKVILRALLQRFGIQLDGATAFFGTEGTAWPAFKARLDETEPALWTDVILGAVQAFEHHTQALRTEAVLF